MAAWAHNNGGSAGAALEHGQYEEIRVMSRIVFHYAYSQSNAVNSVMALSELDLLKCEYLEEIRVEAFIPSDNLPKFRALLDDKTSGRIRWET